MSTNIELLDLNVRAYNCLKRAGINTIEGLLNKTEEDLLKVRNLRRRDGKKIEEKLKEYNNGGMTMCKGSCKCNDKKDQMREMLENIVEGFETYQAITGKNLTLQEKDIEDIKEILEQFK